MTARWGTAVLGIDPVLTAGGLGAVAGVASLFWPFFDGMTAALVALAAVGWLPSLLPGPRAPRSGPRAPALAGILVLLALAAGWTYFLLASGPWVLGRGVALGASGGAVAYVGRKAPAFGEGGG